jgi:hypothetical protein
MNKINFVLLILVFACSCSEKKTSYFYKVYSENNRQEKTVPIDKPQFHHPKDSLLSTSGFFMGDSSYIVKRYSNFNHCGMDGECVCCEVEGFGIIYNSSIVWRGYGILQTDDDYLNAMINRALLNSQFQSDVEFYKKGKY